MESLSLSYNSLSGTLPLELRNMGGLVQNASTSLQLYIDCNELAGDAPDWICDNYPVTDMDEGLCLFAGNNISATESCVPAERNQAPTPPVEKGCPASC